MRIKALLPLIATLFCGNALAIDPQDLLPAEEAYRLSATAEAADRIIAEWQIADGYYMYRKRFKFETEAPGVVLGDPVFPAGLVKEDEFFGRSETYRNSVKIEIPVTRSSNESINIVLKTVSQGCADLGVCYLPQNQPVKLVLAAATPTKPKASSLDEALKNLKQDFSLDGQQQFLQVDEAYNFTVEAISPDRLLARWEIADGYYLYRDKFSFEALTDGVTLGEIALPRGKIKTDEFFGRMEVLYHRVEVQIPLTSVPPTTKKLELKVGYQGCAEAGLCYPPQTRVVALALTAGSNATVATDNQQLSLPAEADEPVSEQDKLAKFLIEKPLWISAGLFFLFGIGLTFTPCVFPMVPIISGIIVGQGARITTGRAFRLSLIYVLAMALTYTVAGVVVALLGANLQAMFQNPWVLGSFAGVFVLLSLSMFGFYELQLPSSMQTRLAELSNSQHGGTFIGVALMGFLSALIVGPCITAPLVAALLVIGQTGDPVLGGTALFALSMGMGVPLLIVGTSAGKLLPHTGKWMDSVKSVFGVLLLGVAIWMLERIIPVQATMLLWSALLILSAVYMGALTGLTTASSGWQKLRKGLGILTLIYGGLLLIGASSGGTDLFQPLKGITLFGSNATEPQSHGLAFKRIKGLDELQREVRLANQNGQAVMLDFYADWCISCKEMERFTFSDTGVQDRLANVITLQADVTANDATDRALLKHFGLVGPPTIMFFDTTGKELSRLRVVGFMDAEEFSAHLDKTGI